MSLFKTGGLKAGTSPGATPSARRTTSLVMAATAALSVIAGGALAVASPLASSAQAASAAAATPSGYELTMKDSDSRQWMIAPDGTQTKTNSALAAGTNPSVANIANGGFVTAFADSNRGLWQGDPFSAAPVTTAIGGFSLPANSSPAVDGDNNNGAFKMVFAANGKMNLVVGSGPNSVPDVIDDPAAPNTSPDITRVGAFGFWEAAWVDANRNVVYIGPDRIVHTVTDFKVQPGTNASIASSGDGFMIAAQADDSRLWLMAGSGLGNVVATKTGSAMNTGTSPSIANSQTGGYQVAFVASDGTLWVTGTQGGVVKSGHIPDGSPEIASSPVDHSWKVAFIGAGSNHLVTFDSASRTVDTGLTMAPHSTPGIAFVTPVVPPPPPTTPPTTPPATQQHSSYTIENCNHVAHSATGNQGLNIFVWVKDLAGGTFNKVSTLSGVPTDHPCGFGSTPARFTFNPIQGHSYVIQVTLDNALGQTACNTNSPTSCLQFVDSFVGNAGSAPRTQRIDV
ncbi:hypothetical protein [Streptomyces sp. RKAG293]|uniref:hypothetical protein n=1 Tax=Streptomyces sp. RKAG293 TaxID=2893403 RepID=UPI00203439E0|nr:hypothetical protein [Streptomyces sp. RKAG293]MCM2416535.1 hypothetical protein [Streptomyces sp. RKAG293]